jgi:L-alanine-DL-glutamate epimerase-like enolase superfamily enzyme
VSPIHLSVSRESWPIAGTFRIARGAKTAAEVVVATVAREGHRGRGECVPYTRYGESVDRAIAELEKFGPRLAATFSRQELGEAMPAGAARNALDCALWDLEAKTLGKPVWELACLPEPKTLLTAFTISLAEPREMAQAAGLAAETRPLLKLKLGAEGDVERLRAVRAAAPEARLVVDANEGWAEADLEELFGVCSEVGVLLIEQPLPATADEVLRDIRRTIPVCADESFHDLSSLPGLIGKYDAVNVKLDKTGGLTEAIRVLAAAKERELAVMVGCMVATSLSMAPAFLLAQEAAFVDLDGPLLLAQDRPDGLRFDGAVVSPPSRMLWGGGRPR